ncbi:MAG: DUF721 domain-containing protein [Marinifilaceae bacterium]|jgi:predicted nucleic acid-binding Zn ribbon protein|nr:DUF721 domain-containing protein [Marinifilaceae bacterium]
MRRSKTQKIDELIDEMLKGTQLEKGLKEHRLIKSWEEVIGKTVANSTTKLYIRNKKLYVYIRSSVIKHQLNMIKEGLVRALNEKVDAYIINDIVFM